jgi:exonuclease III
MRITSWNILHIVHEIKFVGKESIPISAFNIYDKRSNEKQRMNAILNTINEHLNASTTEPIVICLQEVPGDYLTELNKLKDVNVISYQYPRMPSLKSGMGASPYTDISEHIVTLVKNTSIEALPVVQFDDPGKACLAVRIGDVTINNVHMPFGDEHLSKALKQINTEGKQIICGDFNSSPDRLGLILHGSNGKLVVNNIVTHKTIKNGTITPKIYDHFVFYNMPTTGIEVKVQEVNTSDHFPISIVV